jgi:hypothetical protein
MKLEFKEWLELDESILVDAANTIQRLLHVVSTDPISGFAAFADDLRDLPPQNPNVIRLLTTHAEIESSRGEDRIRQAAAQIRGTPVWKQVFNSLKALGITPEKILG